MKKMTNSKLKKSVITNFINPDLAYCLNLDQVETDVLKVEGVSCRFLTAVQKGTCFDDLFKQLTLEYELGVNMKESVQKDYENFVENLKRFSFA